MIIIIFSTSWLIILYIMCSSASKFVNYKLFRKLNIGEREEAVRLQDAAESDILRSYFHI